MVRDHYFLALVLVLHFPSRARSGPIKDRDITSWIRNERGNPPEELEKLITPSSEYLFERGLQTNYLAQQGKISDTWIPCYTHSKMALMFSFSSMMCKILKNSFHTPDIFPYARLN